MIKDQYQTIKLPIYIITTTNAFYYFRNDYAICIIIDKTLAREYNYYSITPAYDLADKRPSEVLYILYYIFIYIINQRHSYEKSLVGEFYIYIIYISPIPIISVRV